MSYSISIGLTGNRYITSRFYGFVRQVCIRIGKSPNSIYFNKKQDVWVARIKSPHHKKALAKFMDSEEYNKKLRVDAIIQNVVGKSPSL